MVSGTESWIPDEVGTAGRENLDEEHVARYDDKEHGAAANSVTVTPFSDGKVKMAVTNSTTG